MLCLVVDASYRVAIYVPIRKESTVVYIYVCVYIYIRVYINNVVILGIDGYVQHQVESILGT